MAQAEGDSQRFSSVLAEYQKAPQVTRDRLYIDTMQQIYSNVTKVMVDIQVGQSNLLYLPLDKIMQMTGQASVRPRFHFGTSAATRDSSPRSTPASRSLDAARAQSRDRDGR